MAHATSPDATPGVYFRRACRCIALLAGCASGAVMAAPQVVLDAATFARLDEYVTRQLEEARIPGAAVAVVQDGRIVHARGYGTAGDAAMTSRTPVMLASLSKSITALAIMQQVEAGKIDLDAPVQRYLPSFRLADPSASAAVTVRHLLSHASGIPPRAWRLHLRAKGVPAGAGGDGALQLAAVRPLAPPGAQFRYANPNYVLLGAILEAVTGEPYADYVHDKVFGPINMPATFASPTRGGDHVPATGFQYFFGMPVRAEPDPYTPALTPAGFIAASAEDMARYLIMMINRGTTDGATVLAPGSVAEMFRPQVRIDENVSYGMGWLVGKVHGHDVVYHTGSTPNATNTYALMAPAEGWGFVLLVNSFAQGPGPRRDALAIGVRDLLMQQDPEPVAWQWGGMPMVAHAALLLLQFLGIAHALHLFRRWHRNPGRRPTAPIKKWGWHVILPALGCAALGIGLLVALPRQLDTSLIEMRRSAPDLFLIGVASAGIALVWGVTRTVMAVRRLSGSPKFH